ncbi:HDOD domain-containing protein [Solidesulfovibrio sp.]
MAKHSIEDVVPGMVAGRDVNSQDGALLAACGATLSEAHLRAMRAYGVRDVDIAGDEDDDGADRDGDALRLEAARDQCRRLLLPRFAALDLEHPFGRIVFRLAVERTAERAVAEGLDLDAVADNPALASLPPEQQLFDAGAVDPASLVSGEVELATLPEVYVRLLSALHSEKATAGDLAAIIGRDPSLSAKLLKLVNSPLYGSRTPVDTIGRAVAMAGQQELTTLVTGLAALSAFSDIAPGLCDMRMFWRHAASCGTYASLLAESVPGAAPDRVFVGGLLHDIGQLVILRKLPAAAGRALLLSRVEGLPANEAEVAVLGFDHAAVGRALLTNWNFPPTLTAMAAEHHQPDGRPQSRETALVHVADILASAWVWPAFCGAPVPPLDEPAWQSLGLPETVLARVARDGDDRISEIESVFFSDPNTPPQ